MHVWYTSSRSLRNEEITAHGGTARTMVALHRAIARQKKKIDVPLDYPWYNKANDLYREFKEFRGGAVTTAVL